MNRQRLKKSLLGIGVILLLLWLNSGVYGFSFTPEQALRRVEQDFLFGPSEIVYTQSLPGEKIFLGRYDDYISFYRVKRCALIYWRDENHLWLENDSSIPVYFRSS